MVASLWVVDHLVALGNHPGMVHSGNWVGQQRMMEPVLLGPSYCLVGAIDPLVAGQVPAVAVGDHQPFLDAVWVILVSVTDLPCPVLQVYYVVQHAYIQPIE